MDLNNINRGDFIAGLRIDDVIAEGGSATVYLGYSESLQTYRALKVMKSDAEKMKNRFVTEARLVANMKHTNIINIHSFNFTEENLPYIEMEYMDGKDLSSLLKEDYNEGIPVDPALSLILLLCKALDYAHKTECNIFYMNVNGVIHRDIKPANVLISKNGDLKLTDFGIAKVEELTTNTMTGTGVLGTSYYLSPEQIKNDPLDERTDIYSLGCLFYEALTGIPAYKHKDLGNLVLCKENDDYDKDLLYKRAPKNVCKIVQKMMMPDRDYRYNSALEVAEVIRNVFRKRKIIDPEECFRNFIKKPEVFEKEKSNYVSLSLDKLIKFVVIIFSICLIIGVFFFVKGQKKTDVVEEIKPQQITKTTPVEKEHIDTFALKEEYEKRGFIIEEKKPVVEKTIKKTVATPKRIKKPEPKVVKKTITFEDFKQANAKDDYNTIKEYLKSKKEFSKEEKKAIIEIIKSDLSKNKNKIVSELFSNLTINDGYYLYLIGKSYLMQSDPKNSERLFNKSLLTKTEFLDDKYKKQIVLSDLLKIKKRYYQMQKSEQTKNEFKKIIKLLLSISIEGDYYYNIAKKELDKLDE